MSDPKVVLHFEAEPTSVACARCSGGSGLLCDKCVLEVAAAAIRDAGPFDDLEPEPGSP